MVVGVCRWRHRKGCLTSPPPPLGTLSDGVGQAVDGYI